MKTLLLLSITFAFAACSTQGLTPEQIAARERRLDAWSTAALGIGTRTADAYLAPRQGYAK